MGPRFRGDDDICGHPDEANWAPAFAGATAKVVIPAKAGIQNL